PAQRRAADLVEVDVEQLALEPAWLGERARIARLGLVGLGQGDARSPRIRPESLELVPVEFGVEEQRLVRARLERPAGPGAGQRLLEALAERVQPGRRHDALPGFRVSPRRPGTAPGPPPTRSPRPSRPRDSG